MSSLITRSVKICLQCRRPRFNSWVGNILWRKKWQPTAVFSSGECHGQRGLADIVHGITGVGGDLETKPPPYVGSQLTSLRSAFFLTTQSKLPSGRPPGTPRSIAPSPFSNSLNDLSWKWSLTPLFCIWVWPCQASVFSVLCQLHLYPSSLFSLPSSKRERFSSAGCQLPVWSPADTVWVITTFFPLQSSSSKLASHFHLPVSHV